VPRFGQPTDFSILFNTTAEASNDQYAYANGTLFVGAFLMAIFFLWLFLLIIFMCCGPRRVGFLAGFKMKHPHDSEKFRTPIVVRFIMILSCLIVIAAAVISTIFFGLKDMKDVANDGLQLVNEYMDLAQDGKDRVAIMSEKIDSMQNLKEIVINELRSENFCSSTNPGEPVETMRNSLVQDLYTLEDFDELQFRDLRVDVFGKMLSDGLRTENYFNYFGVKQWQIWSFLISFSVIAFFFLLGTMVASFGVTDHVISCFNTWIFLPIFLLMVTASWIIVSFYGVGAVMASDYCLTGGSPDATTKAIINQFNIDASQKQLNEYWITCDGELPIIFMPTLQDRLNTAISSITDLRVALVEYKDSLSANCGGKDFASLNSYLGTIADSYDKLDTNITYVENLIDCSNMRPKYEQFTYDIMCTDAPEASSWTFGLLLVIAFFGMLIITFRAAWLNTIPRDARPSSIRMSPSKSEFNDSPRNSPDALSRKSMNDEEYVQNETEDRKLAAELENVHIDDHGLDDEEPTKKKSLFARFRRNSSVEEEPNTEKKSLFSRFRKGEDESPNEPQDIENNEKKSRWFGGRKNKNEGYQKHENEFEEEDEEEYSDGDSYEDESTQNDKKKSWYDE
jgi:hypothetical protein